MFFLIRSVKGKYNTSQRGKKQKKKMQTTRCKFYINFVLKAQQ